MPGETYGVYSTSEAESILLFNGVSGNTYSGKRKRIHDELSSLAGQIPQKRKKGLNSRFDRMMDTVRVMHTDSGATKQRRPRIESSSSVASYGPPRTPVDAYSGLDEGRLGAGFSVLNIQRHTDPVDEDEDIELLADALQPHKRKATRPPPPGWLCDTISTLDNKHPLRVLLPPQEGRKVQEQKVGHPQTVAIPVAVPSPPAEVLDNEEPVFAYRPPPAQLKASARRPESPQSHAYIAHLESPFIETGRNSGFPGSAGLASSSSAADHLHIYEETPLPFSTAGPVLPYAPSSPVLSNISLASKVPVELLPDILGTAAMEVSEEDPELEMLPFSKPGPLAPQVEQAAPLFISTLAGSSSPTSSRMPAGYALEPMFDAVPGARALDRAKMQPPFEITAEAALMSAEDDLHAAPVLRIPKPRKNAPSKPALASRFFRQPTLIVDSELPSEIKLFSTPGPMHPTTQSSRIYFDDPFEDPISSDPVDEADYMLPLDYAANVDVEALDFKWEKFERGGDSDFSEGRTVGRRSSLSLDLKSDSTLHSQALAQLEAHENIGASYMRENTGEDTDEELYWADDTTSWPNVGEIETSAVRQDEALGEANPVDEVSETATQLSPRQAFAPAPGIFVSPLRGEKMEEGEPSGTTSAGNEDASEEGVVLVEDMPIAAPARAKSPRSFQGSDGYRGSGQCMPKHICRHRPIAAKGGVQLEDLDGQEEPECADSVEAAEELGDSQRSHDSIESWSTAGTLS